MGYLINREAFLGIEALGIFACFVGVVLIADSASDPDSQLQQNQTEVGHHANCVLRIAGIAIMLFVAFNDATLAVLARKMKELHFSIMMFWFSVIGLMFLLAYLAIVSLYSHDYPDLVYYSEE